MKEAGHPEYPYATISCACGNSVVTRTTRGDFNTEVCGNCHPFYTGKQKVMDTAGRVDRFNKRFQKAGNVPAAAPAGTKAASTAKKPAADAAAAEEPAKSE